MSTHGPVRAIPSSVGRDLHVVSGGVECGRWGPMLTGGRTARWMARTTCVLRCTKRRATGMHSDTRHTKVALSLGKITTGVNQNCFICFNYNLPSRAQCLPIYDTLCLGRRVCGGSGVAVPPGWEAGGLGPARYHAHHYVPLQCRAGTVMMACWRHGDWTTAARGHSGAVCTEMSLNLLCLDRIYLGKHPM